jgi:cytochrome c oxidase cbb3-type subunit 4
MDVNTLRIAATGASFAIFVVIWGWAWARSNRAGFDEAAQIPFQQD